MIIDLILDRFDGETYNKDHFLDDVRQYEETFDMIADISESVDHGSEREARKALCMYIIENEYNTKICSYINSVNWK